MLQTHGTREAIFHWIVWFIVKAKPKCRFFHVNGQNNAIPLALMDNEHTTNLKRIQTQSILEISFYLQFSTMCILLFVCRRTAK